MSSCFNLRLLPPRKMWKLISTKLQTKFHTVFRRSKVPKKSPTPYRFNKPSKILAPSPVFRVQFKTKRSNKLKHRSRPPINYHKKPAPVYIDQLFIQNIKEDYVQVQPMPITAKTTTDQGQKLISAKEMEPAADEIHQGQGSSIQMVAENANDEMWESLVLASPQSLHGINARAEEFIARFRADMQRQNLLSNHL